MRVHFYMTCTISSFGNLIIIFKRRQSISCPIQDWTQITQKGKKNSRIFSGHERTWSSFNIGQVNENMKKACTKTLYIIPFPTPYGEEKSRRGERQNQFIYPRLFGCMISISYPNGKRACFSLPICIPCLWRLAMGAKDWHVVMYFQ